ncbi:MAG: hypothetical protein AB7V46_24610, partial [Thermomicrobiales bacterium]
MDEDTERLEDVAGLLIKDGGADDDRVDDEVAGGGNIDDGGDDWKSDDEPDQPEDDAETVDEDADGEVDEEEEEGSQPEPHYTVKVDGKDVQVTLKEALEGYSRTQDYTAKTQQIAEARKAIEQEAASHRAARDQYEAILKSLQDKLGTEADEPTQAQWDALKAENPDQYALAWTDYQRRKEARKAVADEQERVSKQKSEEQLAQFRDYIKAENTKLLEKLPSWSDPEKRKVGAKQVFDFASKQYGFSDEELSKAYDHRIVVMAEDARKYHALKTKMANGKTKLEAAPVVPPRARTPQLSGKNKLR